MRSPERNGPDHGREPEKTPRFDPINNVVLPIAGGIILYLLWHYKILDFETIKSILTEEL